MKPESAPEQQFKAIEIGNSHIQASALEVQVLYFRQLAAEENCMEEVAKILGAPSIDLEERYTGRDSD